MMAMTCPKPGSLYLAWAKSVLTKMGALVAYWATEVAGIDVAPKVGARLAEAVAVRVVAPKALLIGLAVGLVRWPSVPTLPSQARAFSDTVPAKLVLGTKRTMSFDESKKAKVAETAGKAVHVPPVLSKYCQTPLVA